MNNINIQFYKTRIGEFILGSTNQKLCLLNYRHKKNRQRIDNRIQKGLMANYIEKDDDVLAQTRTQLDEYLCGNRHEFSIPLQMVGSDFQKSVWNALLEVPYGTTTSYLNIAKKINHEKAVRAVANANGANSISIIIPCHRIIGTNGKLVGYAGGLPTKEKLLMLEKQDDLFNLNKY